MTTPSNNTLAQRIRPSLLPASRPVPLPLSDRLFSPRLILIAGCAALSVAAAPRTGDAPAQPQSTSTMSRLDTAPRKVLLGTMISGYEIFGLPVDKRLDKMDELMATIAAEAEARYPGKNLDLVVFPEDFLARASWGSTAKDRVLRLETVRDRLAACAKRYGCYMVVPMWLEETDTPPRYSNAAVLIDRAGSVVGIYRKVHPVATSADSVEDGTTPGRRFPVFACDFGRLGIQICWDMSYDDGWEALARQGAEIVALPSASPQTRRPAMYAVMHRYYIVNATPRDNATVFNPLGVPEAQVNRGVLVHQIDLSYAILHFSPDLDEGRLMSRKYGDKVGYHYYSTEDTGIFFSNDPTTTIGQMTRALNLAEMDAEIERCRKIQDTVRPGPPIMPAANATTTQDAGE